MYWIGPIFSSYTDFDVKNVPEDVRIINYSFYDRYRKELYFLTGLFILTFYSGIDQSATYAPTFACGT